MCYFVWQWADTETAAGVYGIRGKEAFTFWEVRINPSTQVKSTRPVWWKYIMTPMLKFTSKMTIKSPSRLLKVQWLHWFCIDSVNAVEGFSLVGFTKNLGRSANSCNSATNYNSLTTLSCVSLGSNQKEPGNGCQKIILGPSEDHTSKKHLEKRENTSSREKEDGTLLVIF